MNESFDKTLWNGLEAYRMVNSLYEALILPDYGANCISLIHLPTGTQLLRAPASPDDLKVSAYVYGLPFLFPPNRIKNGTFTMGEKTYSMPINDPPCNSHIHGTLAKLRFDPCDNGVFRYKATSEAPYLAFPHAFTVERRYRLDDDGLHHEIVVTNTGCEPMPCAVGLHSAFSVEEGDTLHLPAMEQIILTSDFLPTGETQKNNPLLSSLRSGLLNTESCALSDQFSVNPGTWTLHRKSVDFCFEPDPAFRYIMIWNQEGGKGFVCPEPQSCAVNALTFGEQAEAFGVRMLRPCEAFTVRMRFYALPCRP